MRALILVLLLAQPAIAIRVSSSNVFADGSIRITCRVEPSADNRLLRIELDDYAASERPLSPSGPITTDVWFHHLPCDVTTARCEVRTVHTTHVASTTIAIIGCY